MKEHEMMQRRSWWSGALRRVLLVLVVGGLAAMPAALPAGTNGQPAVQARIAVQDADAPQTACGFPVMPLDALIDRTFGENGYATVTPVQFGGVRLRFLAADHQGRLLLHSPFVHTAGRSTFTLVRLSTNGSPDQEFGANGVVEHTVPISGFEFYSLDASQIGDDGAFLVVGSGWADASHAIPINALLLFQATGRLAAEFGDAGLVVLRLGTSPISPGGLDAGSHRAGGAPEDLPAEPSFYLPVAGAALSHRREVALVLRSVTATGFVTGESDLWLLMLGNDGSQQSLRAIDEVLGNPVDSRAAISIQLSFNTTWVLTASLLPGQLSPSYSSAVIRLDKAGNRDQSFGTDGIVVLLSTVGKSRLTKVTELTDHRLWLVLSPLSYVQMSPTGQLGRAIDLAAIRLSDGHGCRFIHLATSEKPDGRVRLLILGFNEQVQGQTVHLISTSLNDDIPDLGLAVVLPPGTLAISYRREDDGVLLRLGPRQHEGLNDQITFVRIGLPERGGER